MKFRRIVLLAVYVLFLILLLELWARGYYALKRDMSFFVSPREFVYTWYPELEELSGSDVKGYNVLLLGGSALHECAGNVPKYLAEALAPVVPKKVTIINLAAPAHSTLDSLYKYSRTEDKKFDLVIFYHGINETRANNVPDNIWKDDYSHYSWYREVNFYFGHPLLLKMPFILPYFLEHLLVQLDMEALNKHKYVPMHEPREEWLEYAAKIKTKKTFKNNLEKIVDMASRRNETILVMTYAHYEPKTKDDPYYASAKIWGREEHVTKGIREHNTAIKELAVNGGFLFLDQERLLGGKKEYFTDICHFSDKGGMFFSKNIKEFIYGKDVDTERTMGFF